MSGVRAATPWMREALRMAEPDGLARVEEAIPEGSHITLICGGRPRPLGAILVRDGVQVARVEPAYYSVAAACDAVLRRAEPVVVEDHGSFVVTADRGN